MNRRLHLPGVCRSVALAGALVLSLAPRAFAQLSPAAALPRGLANLFPYTGILTTGGYLPPTIPSTWVSPNYLFDYQVPQVVYVPVAVPVKPSQPAVQPVAVAPVTLHRGTALADLRVTPGTVVTWSNGDDQAFNLVIANSPSSGTAQTGTAPQTWPIRARGSVSLAFNQPGTYAYYRLEDPAHRARITVTG